MKQFSSPQKLQRGDNVAVISPSSGTAGIFPWVQDLGIQRLRDTFQLQATEYPTTRKVGASLQDRAHDIMLAFSDPKNKAIIATIGGNDQIKLLKYLDASVIKSNPKPFFGYSDNTHLHNYLWKLGIPSYYGGSILTQYGMHGAMYPETVSSLEHAFFKSGQIQLVPNQAFNDHEIDWADKSSLELFRTLEKNEGFYWSGSQTVSGILWGGCVESLMYQLAADSYLPSDTELDGAILILESSEDQPSPWVVDYLLSGYGERGWLSRFSGILVGRPKAWGIHKPRSAQESAQYRKTQRATVIDTVRQYNTDIPIVQNLDFGHTDPQIIMPLGQNATINTSARTITLTY